MFSFFFLPFLWSEKFFSLTHSMKLVQHPLHYTNQKTKPKMSNVQGFCYMYLIYWKRVNERRISLYASSFFFVYFDFQHLLFTWNVVIRHDWVDVWRCCIRNGRSKNCIYHIGRMVWRQAHCHHHVLNPNFVCTRNRMVSAIHWTLINYSCPFRYFHS